MGAAVAVEATGETAVGVVEAAAMVTLVKGWKVLLRFESKRASRVIAEHARAWLTT